LKLLSDIASSAQLLRTVGQLGPPDPSQYQVLGQTKDCTTGRSSVIIKPLTIDAAIRHAEGMMKKLRFVLCCRSIEMDSPSSSCFFYSCGHSYCCDLFLFYFTAASSVIRGSRMPSRLHGNDPRPLPWKNVKMEQKKAKVAKANFV
jgi:hypothetical protein